MAGNAARSFLFAATSTVAGFYGTYCVFVSEKPLKVKLKSPFKKSLLSLISYAANAHVDAGEVRVDLRNFNVELDDCSVSFPKNHSIGDSKPEVTLGKFSDAAADQTFYNLQAEHVSLKPCLHQYFSGKGLVKKASVQGVSGFLDKRHCVIRNEPWKYTANSPFDLFITDGFTAENVCVDVHYPDVSYPINLNIKHLYVPVLRKKHLFEDFLNAGYAVGVYNLRSFFELREKRLLVENVPVELLRTNIDSADPLQVVKDAMIDIEASWKDDSTSQQKIFSFLLKFKDIQLAETGAPFPKSVVSFLNHKRMCLDLKSEFAIRSHEFVGCWSHNDCGISSAIKNGSVRAYRRQIASPAFQMGLLKEYGIWTLQSALPKFNSLFSSVPLSEAAASKK